MELFWSEVQSLLRLLRHYLRTFCDFGCPHRKQTEGELKVHSTSELCGALCPFILFPYIKAACHNLIFAVVLAKYNSAIAERDSLTSGYASYQSFSDPVDTKKNIDIESRLEITTTAVVQTSVEITKAYIFSAFIMVLNTFGIPRAPESYLPLDCGPNSEYSASSKNPAIEALKAVKIKKKTSHTSNFPLSHVSHKRIHTPVQDEYNAIALIQQTRPHHVSSKNKAGMNTYK